MNVELEKVWCVYVLRSLKNGRRYTGSTDNVERRLKEHNAGETKSIRNSRPYVLVHQETYSSHLEASKREKFLKSGKGRAFLDALKMEDFPDSA